MALALKKIFLSCVLGLPYIERYSSLYKYSSYIYMKQLGDYRPIENVTSAPRRMSVHRLFNHTLPQLPRHRDSLPAIPEAGNGPCSGVDKVSSPHFDKNVISSRLGESARAVA